MATTQPRILVTGATGYIGGRLVRELIAHGHAVRCLVRSPARVEDDIRQACELVVGDVNQEDDLENALSGIEQAYYLIHAMRDRSEDFALKDREQARTFATACAAAKVQRIIYLGGLGGDSAHLSEHLQSRHEVGAALASTQVPVLEFRAAVIVGSGSASFEMIRHLAERLPVMITPRWVRTRCQPIAVRTVLAYLVQALKRPDADGIFEIGGADVLSYADMLTEYAAVRGIRRILIPVPVLTPGLSSWWVHLVTPIPRSIARPLIDGLRCEVVVRDQRAREVFDVQPMPYREAVSRALRRIARGDRDTVWHSSFSSLSDRTPASATFVNCEGLLIEKHERMVPVHPDLAFAACARIGGDHGWPGCHWLWKMRAVLDRLIGGIGFRRGRRHPYELHTGEALDFWRVEHVEPGSEILLFAEMKLPGDGWLQLKVTPCDGGSMVSTTAFFLPRGVGGFVYWGLTMPLHRLVFPALTKGLARWAQTASGLRPAIRLPGSKPV